MRAERTSGRDPMARWRRFTLLVALLAAMVLLSACATIGHKFPAARVSEIRTGETTQAEIQQMFGAPWRVGMEDGRRTWTYGRYRYKLFGTPTATDLVIRFDDAGRVASYTFNTTEREP